MFLKTYQKVTGSQISPLYDSIPLGGINRQEDKGLQNDFIIFWSQTNYYMVSCNGGNRLEWGEDHIIIPSSQKWKKGRRKPFNHFKFNIEWIKDDIFIKMVKGQWVTFDKYSGEDATVQFVSNLNKVKHATVACENKK